MKNHTRSHGKSNSPGYRTPSHFRFTRLQQARDQKIKNSFTQKNIFTDEVGKK